jgi:chaperonin GroES
MGFRFSYLQKILVTPRVSVLKLPMGGRDNAPPTKRVFIDRIEFTSGGSLSMDIRPLHDRVVVKRIEEGESMQGGLYIPDSAKEKPQQGEVVAVGKGKRADDGKLMALDVQIGDRILFGKYSGNDIKLDGNEYLIMREDEILGVLSNGAKNAGAK